MYRILMRRDQVLKLCANHRITSELKFEIFNEKQVRWQAQDFSENDGKYELLAARFKNQEEAQKFKSECEKAQKEEPVKSDETIKKTEVTKDFCAGLKPKLSEMFKTTDWKCTSCYAPNKIDSNKCACCATLKPGAVVDESEKKTEATLSNAIGKIGITSATTSVFSFGAPSNNTIPGTWMDYFSF